jgi:hypothetical protein
MASGQTRLVMGGLALGLVLAGCQTVPAPPPTATLPPPPTVAPAPPTVPASTPTLSLASPTLTPSSAPATRPPAVTAAPTTSAPGATATRFVPQVGSTVVPPTPYAGASVGLGQPFALKIGQGVAIQGTDLRLEFRAIAEDSRCPADVNCVWSGRAVATLAATQATQPAAMLTIATCCPFDQANRVQHAGHELRLLRVLPARLYHAVPIKPEEYLIELTVTRPAAGGGLATG